jgi:P3 major capsid protein
MATPAPQYTAQQNQQAREYILANSREMFQQVYSQAVPAPIVGNQQTIQLRNVGLVKRLIVEVTGTVAAAGAETQNLTKWGLANIMSNMNVTDLSNYQRINTAGWHLYALASLRRQSAYGASYLNDAPVSMGSNVKVMDGAQSINAGTGAQSFRAFYELPLAYSDVDLRGSIYSAVVNATWQLQFTINPQFFVATGADATLGVYQSTTAAVGTLSNVTVTVYQVYLDQLPFVGGQPVLPYFDIATGYLIQNTNVVGLTANQDFPIQYPNFRQILSTAFLYDNGGQQNPGTDLNYIGIQAANLVFLYKSDPFTVALKTRNTIGDDYPAGGYVLETRMQPINTTAYGNMQLVLNPSLVNANANVLIGYEMMGIINQVAAAGSLAGN